MISPIVGIWPSTSDWLRATYRPPFMGSLSQRKNNSFDGIYNPRSNGGVERRSRFAVLVGRSGDATPPIFWEEDDSGPLKRETPVSRLRASVAPPFETASFVRTHSGFAAQNPEAGNYDSETGLSFWHPSKRNDEPYEMREEQ